MSSAADFLPPFNDDPNATQPPVATRSLVVSGDDRSDDMAAYTAFNRVELEAIADVMPPRDSDVDTLAVIAVQFVRLTQAVDNRFNLAFLEAQGIIEVIADGYARVHEKAATYTFTDIAKLRARMMHTEYECERAALARESQAS